jgi:hypothetical protein
VKELSFFWTVTGCPVVTVFLGDRRCAPTPPLPLVCRAARLPQPPPFDISAPESSMDQPFGCLARLAGVRKQCIQAGQPCHSPCFSTANALRICSSSHILRRRSIPLPPEWETLHDANQPPFYVNHATRRSTFERPIPVSVLWQL